MKTRRDFITGAMFACCLAIGVNSVEAAALQRRSCDYALQPFRQDKSELQRDEKELESDINVLRKLLRRHSSQERIARLRYLVRQDWHQIVLDRGHSRPCQEDQSQYLVNRRVDQNAQSERRWWLGRDPSLSLRMKSPQFYLR